MRTALAILVCVSLFSSACRWEPPPPWTVAVQPVASPASGESMSPQLTTSSRGVILSWIERSGDTNVLKFSQRAGAGWSTPLAVISGERWFLSEADVPSVFRKADGTLVANWLPEIDATLEAYHVQLAYSKDEGKTWSAPFQPYTDRTMTQHGFASFFDLPNNGLGLVWLDARAQELDAASPDGGATALRSATFDADWKQTSETVTDARVCDCCQTTAANTGDGPLTVYRDRSSTEVRDIRVGRWNGSAFVEGPLVHADNWEIPACPVNGPALATHERLVATAWFTAVGEEGHAYAAFSSDAGRTWGQPVRLDDAGSTGHVGIVLLEDGSAVASWEEVNGELRMRRVEASATKSPAVAVGARPGGPAKLAYANGELLLAWSEGGQIKTAAAPVPRATAVR